eukprot:27971_1
MIMNIYIKMKMKMICGCPILYKQFNCNNGINNNKCLLQIFLIDLYFECVNRVYKQLKKCNEVAEQSKIIRNDIGLIMESILILSVNSSNITPQIVQSNVTVCCLKNLFKIKNKKKKKKKDRKCVVLGKSVVSGGGRL